MAKKKVDKEKSMITLDVELSYIQTFKKIMNVIAGILDEGFIVFTKDQMKINGWDIEKHSAVYFAIDKIGFDEWNVEKPTEIFISIIDFNKIINRVQPEEKIRFVYNEEDRKFRIIFHHIKGRKRTFNHVTEEAVNAFGDKIIWSDLSKVPLFEIEYEAWTLIDIHDIDLITNDAALYSTIEEAVVFEGTEDTFFISAEGINGALECEFTKDDMNFAFYEDFRVNLSIPYIRKIMKLPSARGTMRFKNEHPLSFEFRYHESFLFKYFIGLRNEDEDEEDPEWEEGDFE